MTGDATTPAGHGAKVLVHICNDEGLWGAGFVLAISKRWKEPERRYREWFWQEPKPALGQVQFVEVEKDLTVANMIGQHGVSPEAGQPPIRYEAVKMALKKVAEFALEREASVHMPRIGCGLAGGKWELIEPAIEQTLISSGLPVLVYDFAGGR